MQSAFVIKMENDFNYLLQKQNLQLNRQIPIYEIKTAISGAHDDALYYFRIAIISFLIIISELIYKIDKFNY